MMRNTQRDCMLLKQDFLILFWSSWPIYYKRTVWCLRAFRTLLLKNLLHLFIIAFCPFSDDKIKLIGNHPNKTCIDKSSTLVYCERLPFNTKVKYFHSNEQGVQFQYFLGSKAYQYLGCEMILVIRAHNSVNIIHYTPESRSRVTGS